MRQSQRTNARSTNDRDDGHEPGDDGARRIGPSCRRQLEEERERRGADERPENELRRLVEREMPKDATVAVVEPEQLRDEDPDREIDERPCELAARRRRPTKTSERLASKRGDDVGAASIRRRSAYRHTSRLASARRLLGQCRAGPSTASPRLSRGPRLDG